jgi:positive regulator of sigma E activity
VTETGKVTKINGAFVTLKCKPCLSCHACGARHCVQTGREVAARNTLNIPLALGDEAEISVPATKTIGSILKVFGIPVLVFILAYVGVHLSGGTEAACVLSSLAGLFISAAAIALLGRRSASFPEVLRAVEQPDS